MPFSIRASWEFTTVLAFLVCGEGTCVLAGRHSNLIDTRTLRQLAKPCLGDFVFEWLMLFIFFCKPVDARKGFFLRDSCFDGGISNVKVVCAEVLLARASACARHCCRQETGLGKNEWAMVTGGLLWQWIGGHLLWMWWRWSFEWLRKGKRACTFCGYAKNYCGCFFGREISKPL